MGCDIHTSVERLEGKPDPSWVLLPPPEIELYYYPDSMNKPALGEFWYWGRNYSLFTFLAGVRDDAAYAGKANRCLDLPRGVPADASPEYRKLVDDWGPDGHTHSYFTLRELVHAPYDEMTFLESAMVDDHYKDGGTGRAAEFARRSTAAADTDWSFLDETGDPMMCQGTNQRGFQRVEWTVSGRSYVGEEWFKTLDRLKPLTFDDGSDVRFLFFFDN